MRKILTIAVLTIGVLASATTRANAQDIAVCFKTAQFSDIYAMQYFFTAANYLTGEGRSTVSGNLIASTIRLSGGVATVALSSFLPAGGTSHPYWISAGLSLATLSGSGRCEAVNTAAGCGTSIPITMSVVACPAGAFDGAATNDAATLAASIGGPGGWQE